MNFTDTKILDCGTPSCDLVSYLYDEASEIERERFEGHMLECDDCTSEFASLSLARLEVYEWHRDEFAEIPTPIFTVPYDRPTPAGSWFSELSGIFTWNGGRTAGGLAAAALAVMIGGWFVFSSNSGSEGIARVDNSNTSVIESGNVQSPSPIVQPEKGSDLKEKPEITRENVVEVSAPLKAAPAKAARPNVTKVARPAASRPAAVQAQRKSAPRLNGTEDEADTTLRLADLLAEIDTVD